MNARFSMFLLFLILLFAGALGGFYYYKAEWTPPVLSVTPDQPKASAKTIFSVNASDEGSGLKTLQIFIQQGDASVEVVNKTFTSGTAAIAEQFSVPKTGLKNGPLTLNVVVTDASWHRFGRGNSAKFVRDMQYDSKPPAVSVLSGQHHVNQGGTGFLVYTSDEPLSMSGVQIGTHFFPGHQDQASGKYFCFFAIPYNMDLKTINPILQAKDTADNEANTSFTLRPIPKQFKHDSIGLSDNFLQSKMSQFTDLYPNLAQPLDIFIKVNSELRNNNVARLLEIAQDTVNQKLWDGPFVRLPNSAPMAGFGDNRTYIYQNKAVDNQTHMGVDLASLINSPIPAGNSGRIVFAEFMGIYGKLVIIDHGFGVHSLYSHLSEISVHKGDMVKRGQIIGKTGTTGMAGGDHLHFGMMINGLQVQPIEWWDPHWIKDNITSKLQ